MKLFAKTVLSFVLLIPTFSSAQIVFVNHAATGLNNGTDWENAFTDLQAALYSIPAPDTIWVAKGTYYPTNETDRYTSFEISGGMALFGGFEGNETELSQRNWEINETILSGDIGIPGDHSDNSFTVIAATYTDTTTLFDGFKVMHGNANSQVPLELNYGRTKCGGGMHIDGYAEGNEATIKINNCIFSNNKASIYGGAIFFSGQAGYTNFIISNTKFISNQSKNGGAVSKVGGCNLFQQFNSCTFENNSAIQGYGGAYSTIETNVSINLEFYDCIFTNNEAHLGGAFYKGGSFNVNDNDLLIHECVFEGNSGITYGGAICDESFYSTGNIQIQNSSFIDNSSSMNSQEDGIILKYSLTSFIGELLIENCNFFENNAQCINTNYNLFLYNNLFYKNTQRNSTVRNSGNLSKTYLINNTFYKNKTIVENGAEGFASSSVFSGESDTKVINSIFWKNETYLQTGSTFSVNGSDLDIENSIFDANSCDEIQNQFATGDIHCGSNVLLNIDPLFRDTANLDFSLRACSPAINAGQNEIIDSFQLTSDIEGNTRILEGIVDIGAYEQAYLATIDSLQHESCFGHSNGAVFLSSSGNLPIDISWESEGIFGSNTDNLIPGLYEFYITDADGCSDTLAIEIEAAAGLTTDFESNDASAVDVADGYIEFEVISGGTPGYTYEWNTGATTASISDLLPGNYFLTVTDALFCKYGFAFSVGVTTKTISLDHKSGFKIYPNPVHDFLILKIQSPLTKAHHFQLINAFGRIVLEKEIPTLTDNFKIPMHSLLDGFYHFIIFNELKIVKTGKLVLAKN